MLSHVPLGEPENGKTHKSDSRQVEGYEVVHVRIIFHHFTSEKALFWS